MWVRTFVWQWVRAGKCPPSSSHQLFFETHIAQAGALFRVKRRRGWGGGGLVRTADGVLICVVCTVVSRATSFDELEFRARATSAPLGLTKKSTCAV